MVTGSVSVAYKSNKDLAAANSQAGSTAAGAGVGNPQSAIDTYEYGSGHTNCSATS
jgi:hypothetical protein